MAVQGEGPVCSSRKGGQAKLRAVVEFIILIVGSDGGCCVAATSPHVLDRCTGRGDASARFAIRFPPFLPAEKAIAATTQLKALRTSRCPPPLMRSPTASSPTPSTSPTSASCFAAAASVADCHVNLPRVQCDLLRPRPFVVGDGHLLLLSPDRPRWVLRVTLSLLEN